MNQNNVCTFLISLNLCIFFVIILSKRSSGADYRFEACVPRNCGRLNISFPFHIPVLQESYCGFPGKFTLSCNSLGLPILQLPENNYAVEHISYENRTFRVYDAAFLSSSGSNCIPRIRNTTLPEPEFNYINATRLHLFSNCSKPLSQDLLRYKVVCDGVGSDSNWELALYDDSNDLRIALEECEGHVVAPVGERDGIDGNSGIENVVEVLRKGFELNWTASDCNTCETSGGHCGFNETTYHFQCFCPDRPHSRSCRPEKSRKKLVIATSVSVAALMITASSVIWFIFFRKKLINLHRIQKRKTVNQMDIEHFLKDSGNLAPKIYKYSELKKITNSFSDNLGKGGYGSVYKGELQDGRLVAVKVLNESKGNGEEFMNEVASFSRTSHINIVTLLGFCFEGSKRALVYEFMPNGSLEKYIPNTASSTAGVLGWEKLFEIVVGIARGLEYLHQGCNTRILHFDIKPHNILLDKDMKPKISDFGLARLCPNRSSIISMLGARGTAGYIAPEVFCRNFGEVSHKSDIYSYGMMVLEIVLGRRKIDPHADQSSEMYFTDWIYNNLEQNVETSLVDSILIEGDEWKFAKKKLIIIGLWCIQTEPKNRPSISKVIEMLEGNVESLQVPPRPYLSSSPRLIASVSASDST